MKILFVITQGDWGGAQRYVYDLATHLNPGEFNVSVAVGAETQGELVEKLKARRISVYPLHRLRRSMNPLTNGLFIIELRRLLAKLSPDVVHFNSTNAGVFGPFAVWLHKLILHFSPQSPRLRPPKVIYTAHGFPFQEPGALRRIIFSLAERLAAPLRDRTICVSRADYQAAIRKGIAAPPKLLHIPNGVDAESLDLLPAREARQELFPDLPENAILVGAISNLYPNKGFRYLVEAAALLKKESANIRFAIAGSGPEEAFLRMLISRRGLTKQFHLFPYRESGARFLRAFDIIVSPSIKEGLPYFLIEASLAERAIVASAVGGVPEIINNRESGAVVPPKDPAALAWAIRELADSKQLRDEFGVRASSHARAQFPLTRMIQNTERCYLSV